ncbi:unnamed protein product [Protopolystoma xenopodis]|uniref:Uncharacterized protein n=1 Tax=Protopolystoma xenopodis TaxID=117903 RepID=A0A448WZ34_9PLAT|nr:unnamed protein product [Protopolystoma xenopodis]
MRIGWHTLDQSAVDGRRPTGIASALASRHSHVARVRAAPHRTPRTARTARTPLAPVHRFACVKAGRASAKLNSEETFWWWTQPHLLFTSDAPGASSFEAEATGLSKRLDRRPPPQSCTMFSQPQVNKTIRLLLSRSAD